jgi:hypothetical protein
MNGAEVPVIMSSTDLAAKARLRIERKTGPAEWRPFEDAREFARSLGLKDLGEWTAYVKGRVRHLGRLPADIPACPHVDYCDRGFVDYDDWLGLSKSRTP